MRKALFCLMLSCVSLAVCQAQHGWAAIDGIMLKDCPTEYGEYSAKAVVKDYLLTEVRVYSNGNLLQTIRPKGEDDMLAAPVYAESADQLVHFPDANNDGYRDLFVGPGGSRSMNSLFLWNPASNRFELCPSAADMQNPLFCPQEGAIYDGGSNSAWEYYISKAEWNGMELNPTENLEITNNLADYNKHADPEYRKTHKYVLTKDNGKVLKTNKVKDLPVGWQRAIKKLIE